MIGPTASSHLNVRIAELSSRTFCCAYRKFHRPPNRGLDSSVGEPTTDPVPRPTTDCVRGDSGMKQRRRVHRAACGSAARAGPSVQPGTGPRLGGPNVDFSSGAVVGTGRGVAGVQIEGVVDYEGVGGVVSRGELSVSLQDGSHSCAPSCNPGATPASPRDRRRVYLLKKMSDFDDGLDYPQPSIRGSDAEPRRS